MSYYNYLIHAVIPMDSEKFCDAKCLSKREDVKFSDKLYLGLKIKTCKSCKDLIDCLKWKQILYCELEKINKQNNKS